MMRIYVCIWAKNKRIGIGIIPPLCNLLLLLTAFFLGPVELVSLLHISLHFDWKSFVEKNKVWHYSIERIWQRNWLLKKDTKKTSNNILMVNNRRNLECVCVCVCVNVYALFSKYSILMLFLKLGWNLKLRKSS